MDFDPSEFEKLIEGCEVASRIEKENRKKHELKKITDLGSEKLNESIEIIEKRDFVKIRILKTGELVNVDIPDRILAPSELHELIQDLYAVKHKMEKLRSARATIFRDPEG
jgi:DNA-binding protein YbaB